MNNKNKALICIDFINDIIHPNGKLAGKGYGDFIQAHNTLINLAIAQRILRENNYLVVHVRIGFSSDYIEHPAGSPLFGKAKEFQALHLGGWGTEFVDGIGIVDGDYSLTKHRISAFFGTNLDLILKTQNVQELYIAGVATDLAVESTSRDAHDRDYSVTVLSDCCAAASIADHTNSLATLQKIASVKTIQGLTTI